MNNIAGYNAEVPNNIKRILREKNLMQSDVARQAGYTKQAFCDMLQNRKIIKASDIISVSQALGVSAGELFQKK